MFKFCVSNDVSFTYFGFLKVAYIFWDTRYYPLVAICSIVFSKSQRDEYEEYHGISRLNSGSVIGGDETAVYPHTSMCYARMFAEGIAVCPNAIFFLLHSDANPQNYGLVLACFSLSCNPGAISLSRVAIHMESENHAVSSPPLKLPGWTRAITGTTSESFCKAIWQRSWGAFQFCDSALTTLNMSRGAQNRTFDLLWPKQFMLGYISSNLS